MDNESNNPPRVIVVTGGSGGIGVDLIETLLLQNFRVFACSRRISPELKNLMIRFPEEINFVELDLSSSESIRKCSEQIHKQTPSGIFSLINCAGIAHGSLFTMTRKADLLNVYNVNLFGVLEFTQLIVKKMIKARCGVVINLASTAGLLSDKGTLAYGGAKAALIHSTKVIARELGAYGIRVNSIAPSVVETPMAQQMDENAIKSLDARSMIQSKIFPNEISGLVKFLLSDDAVNITGQIIKIDRGLT